MNVNRTTAWFGGFERHAARKRDWSIL